MHAWFLLIFILLKNPLVDGLLKCMMQTNFLYILLPFYLYYYLWVKYAAFYTQNFHFN